MADQNKFTASIGKRVKTIVAVAVALFMVIPVTALAAGESVNTNKKATLTLNAESSSAYGCIRKSDTVTLTAALSNLAGGTVQAGVYGFTIDVIYDAAAFSYVSGSARLQTTSPNFKVDANPNVSAGQNVVTVLFYANDSEGGLSGISADSNLFSLDFTVTGDVTKTANLTPFDWKFADKKSSTNGFELIGLTPAPTAKTLSLKKIKAGDINGDNAVSVLDLVVLKKYLAQTKDLTGGDLLAASADGLGSPNTSDLVWMRREILGLN